MALMTWAALAARSTAGDIVVCSQAIGEHIYVITPSKMISADPFWSTDGGGNPTAVAASGPDYRRSIP
jgi:hypothetical protein